MDDKPAMYQKLDQVDLIRLENVFKSAPEQKFTIKELENILKQFDITFSASGLKSLFMKVKLKFICLFVINW